MGRPAARVCLTPGCGKGVTLYPHCAECRVKDCTHAETHYDSNNAKICSQCGTMLIFRTKKNNGGHGQKAHWQQGGRLTSRKQEGLV